MPDKLMNLAHADIVPAGDNVRADIGDVSELMASIAAFGVLEPLRAQKEGGKYRLIAGERRWTAVGLGIELGELPADFAVPVVVQAQAPDDARTAMMLIENMQRSDLTPVDEAKALAALVNDHGWTKAELATKLGVSKAFVSDRLAIATLPDDAHAMVLSKQLNLASAIEMGKLPAAVKEKLAAKTNLSGFDIQTAVGQAKRQRELDATIKHLRKKNMIVLTSKRAGELIDSDGTDLEGDEQLGRQLLGMLGDGRFAKRITSYHSDAVPAYADLLMGPNHVFSFDVSTYGATWYHWTNPDIQEELDDDESEDELSDYDRAYDAANERYQQERAKHEEQVLKAKILYVNDTKPATLLQQAAMHIIGEKLRMNAARTGQLLGLVDATAEDVITYAAANSANLTRALFAACHHGYPSIDIPMEVGEAPRLVGPPEEDYDEDGNYIHPSEGEAAA
jgi:ParB/RepB/Spo0J family partition protein